MNSPGKAAIYLGMIIGAACQHLSPEPELDNWSTFERRIAHWFDQNYGRANNMRFEPAAITYPVGTILRRGSQSELTADCRYAQVEPSPEGGPRLPDILASRTIDAHVDANSYAAQLLGEGSKLNAGLKVGPTLKVKMIDPVVVILAEDQTTSVLRNPQCLAHLEGQQISIVRGYVEAKYSISSSTGGSANVQATVKTNDLVKVIATGTNSFSVEDASPSKKLVILADAQITKDADPKSFGLLANGQVVCERKVVITGKNTPQPPHPSDCVDTELPATANNPEITELCRVHPEFCPRNQQVF